MELLLFGLALGTLIIAERVPRLQFQPSPFFRHSTRTLDWLATFRAHLLEHTLRNLLSPVLLIVAGFPLPAVAGAGVIFSVWAACNHANVQLSLKFLDVLFITSRLHRLHHVPATSTQNLGAVFSLWDRICGSFLTLPAADHALLGVPGEITTYPQGWWAQFVEPLHRLCR